MRIWICSLAVLIVLSGETVLSAAEFTQDPIAVRCGETVTIRFAVSELTDVAVFIEDAKGRVVRHLVAGRLGQNPPAPLEPHSLFQSIQWDGRDDQGKLATSGPFQLGIGIGLKPKLDGFIGYNPQVVGSIRAMTVDQHGELYVFNVVPNIHGGDGTTVCQVFNRQGKYLRTIMPYPANLPDEKLRGLRRLELPDGRHVPFIHQGETRSFYPGVGEVPRQRPILTSDGRLAFVAIQEYGRYAQPGVNRVTVVHTDGSVPPTGILGPKLADKVASAASLVLSPDEKWLYATGLYDGYRGTYWEKCKWHHVVYRFCWQDKEVKPFLGSLYEPGSDQKHFNDPRSVDTDSQGNLYVADRGNNRVVVFNSQGSYLGELKVEKPSWVEVHPRTGVLYVMVGGPLNTLIKFSGWKEGKELARCQLPNTINGGRRHLWPVMAVDVLAKPLVVWVGAPSRYCNFTLLRFEDKGRAFSQPVEVTKLGNGGPSVGLVTDISLDRQRQWLYVRRCGFFDAHTGKLLDIKLPKLSGSGPIASFGADGNLYVYEGYPNAFVKRYSPDIQPLPFGTEQDRIPNLGSPRVHGRGLVTDQQGNIFVLYQKPESKQIPGDRKDANALQRYAPDGTLKKEHLVDSQVRQIHSVRVDHEGNIYLAAGLRPGKTLLPPGLQGRITGLKQYKYGISPLELNWYPMMYGSIIKFPPTGGVIRKAVGGQSANYGFGTPIEVKGAFWIHPGVSNVPSWRTEGTPDVCLCVPVRFDVDEFGRVFYPDAARFCVGVLDTDGNVILHFGSYGNQDSAGPNSAIGEPEIAFAWPQIVAADSKAVYVADQLNRRIVRVKLTYTSEATCKISGQ